MWIANLSNGNEIKETDPLPGERTTWHNLIDLCRRNGLTITQVRMSNNGTTVVGIPKADGYICFYEARMSIFTGKRSDVQGIGSVIGNQVVISWMNEEGAVWQDLRPLEEVRVHSTLR